MDDLAYRAYLLHACFAELEHRLGNFLPAVAHYDRALDLVVNQQERSYLQKKRVTALEG